MDITDETQAVVNALSRKLKVEPTKIQEGIAKIMADKKCTDKVALSYWKNRNRGLFTSKAYDFLVFGKSEPREIKVKQRNSDEKRDALVANLNVIVENGSGLEAYTISLWDDDAPSVSDFAIGDKYVARMKLTNKGYANIIGGEVEKAPDSKLPDIDAMMADVEAKDIEDATELIGESGFFKGAVSRVIDGGVEVDSPTGLPIMCWTDIKDDFDIGQEVVVYGRVAESKRGDTVIYATALSKLNTE